MANPDDPLLYRDSKFDLSPERAGREKIKAAKTIKNKFENISAKGLYVKAIDIFFGFKYKLQNFRLLPTSEQKKIIIRIVMVTSILAIIIYILINNYNNSQEEALII